MGRLNRDKMVLNQVHFTLGWSSYNFDYLTWLLIICKVGEFFLLFLDVKVLRIFGTRLVFCKCYLSCKCNTNITVNPSQLPQSTPSQSTSRLRKILSKVFLKFQFVQLWEGRLSSEYSILKCFENEVWTSSISPPVELQQTIIITSGQSEIALV